MKAGFPGLAEVRDAHPGDLAVLLSDVDADDVRGWGTEAVEAFVVASVRVQAWSAAMQSVGVDRFAELVGDAREVHVAELRAGGDLPSGAPAGVPDEAAIAAGSLAPLLNLSPRTMRTRVERARALGELPATLAVALAGRLEPWRVDAVVDASMGVGRARLAEFEARLYATDVTGLPKPRLAERARAAAAKADPEGTAAARKAAPRRRGLRVHPHPDAPGLMRWTADLLDEQSRTLLAAVDELAAQYLAADDAARAAARAAGESTLPGKRSVAAARIDALVDLAMADATVTTVVELVLTPQSVPAATPVERPAWDDVVAAALSGPGPGRDGPTPPTPPAWAAHEAPDPVLVDLVAGRNSHDAIAAGQLERELGSRLGAHLEITGNPFLTLVPPPDRPPPACGGSGNPPLGAGAVPTRTAHGEPVWFVDGLVQAPGTSGLLPAQVVAILEDPDTTLRIGGGPVGNADGGPARRRSYRPGAALAAKVRARDAHCRFPGCSVPARRCHLDHVVPHPDGETCEENLCALCPAHHAFKHHAGWRLAMAPDGTCRWTAPTGREHVTEPATRRDTAA